MSERDSYNPGEFCWVDLSSPDVDASAAFYRSLIGWEFERAEPAEEAGGYGTLTHEGKAVAGLGPIQNEGQPPAWSSYVSVADADATAKKIADAGGTVLFDPFDVFDVGRMAVCQDPEGAVFSLWQPKSFAGAELVNEVGTWTWNQLATRDLEQAERFYGEVFGWSAEASEQAPPDSPYLMWQVEGQRWDEGLAGLMTMGEEMPTEVPAHWMVYFAVADAGQAVETVKAGGGQLLFGPQEIPVGKLASFSDPQGATFSVIEPDYPEGR